MKQVQKDKSPNVGLVLSGGGIRGVAHIGLIKALEELDIHPTHLSGTSAGAMIAALYAGGCTAEQMLDIFKTRSPLKFAHFSFYKPGLMDSEKFGNYIYEEVLPHNSFEQLSKKLYITATNITDGKMTIFSEGDNLINTLLASCALPMIYSPVEIEGKLYADGGILNNFPTEPLLGQCDIILGSYVSPVKSVDNEELSSSLKVMMRVFDISTAYCREKFKSCDWVFDPSGLDEFGMFDRKQVDMIFELGYQSAMAEKEALKALFKEEQITEPPAATHSSKNRFIHFLSSRFSNFNASKAS